MCGKVHAERDAGLARANRSAAATPKYCGLHHSRGFQPFANPESGGDVRDIMPARFITVMGAIGHTGKQITEALLEAGEKVRADEAA